MAEPMRKREPDTTPPTARTGETVNAGTYRCEQCGNDLTFTHTGHLPPCPVCAKTEFRRV
jgi:rubrerythrin